MAAYAYHAMVLGYTDASLNQFFINALSALSKDLGMDELLPIVMEVGRFNLLCMELLDTANTESFGDPVPVTVPLSLIHIRQKILESTSIHMARCFRHTHTQN